MLSTSGDIHSNSRSGKSFISYLNMSPKEIQFPVIVMKTETVKKFKKWLKQKWCAVARKQTH